MTARDGGGFSNAYRYYVLAVLLAANTFSILDRLILSILQESIKADLGLSDSQLGILSGFCFAFFYAVLGIPVARLADRSRRTRLIAISLAVWSIMTVLCGFARNFLMMLVFRIGLAVGEAGCTPPAHSLIADYFPKERRGTALSIFSLGGPLGVVLGLAVGGWLDETVGWRMAFVAAGAPAFAIAVIAFLTLREPPRGLADGLASREHSQLRFSEVTKILWTTTPFRNLAIGYSLMSVVSNAVVNWNPPFYSRVHDLGSAQAGLWLALVYAIPLAAGTFLGGALGDRLAHRDVRWYLLFPGFVAFVALPIALAQYTVDSAVLSLLLGMVPAFAFGAYVGPCFTVTQMLVPVSMRASASAVLLLIVSLSGVALGPVIVGALSDLLHARGHGPGALGMALTLVAFVLIPAGVFMLLAARSLPVAVDRLAAQT